MRLLGFLYLFLIALYLGLRLTFGDAPKLMSLANTFAPVYFLPLLVLFPLSFTKRYRVFLPWSLALLLIAGGWFGPYFLPHVTEAQLEPQLSVLSYNIRGEYIELVDYLRAEQPDVVFIQETPKDPWYLQNLLSELGDVYPYVDSQPSYWGNTILSRYPLYDAETLSDIGASPPLRVEVEVGAERIALYNVHLTNPLNGSSRLKLFGFNVRGGYNDGPRQRQIRRLVSQLQLEPLPFIVAGDFNLSQHAAIYSLLETVAKDSYREAGSGWGNTWPDATRFDIVPNFLPPLLRLDYVWYGGNLRAVNAERGPALGSDHYPLAVSFAFEREMAQR